MTEKTVQVVVEFIKTVGVPAAIAFFVLWRLDGHMIELRNEMRALNGNLVQVIQAK